MESLVNGPPQRISSPAPVTATSPKTLSRAVPYFTARGPPALVARLPPTLHWSALDGSGGQNNPCGASARCRSPFNTPGSTTAQRSSGLIAMMRFMRANETTTPPDVGTAAPVVPVPLPRATSGTWCLRQVRTSATICSRSCGKATASGSEWRQELSLPCAWRDAMSVHQPSPSSAENSVSSSMGSGVFIARF